MLHIKFHCNRLNDFGEEFFNTLAYTGVAVMLVLRVLTICINFHTRALKSLHTEFGFK